MNDITCPKCKGRGTRLDRMIKKEFTCDGCRGVGTIKPPKEVKKLIQPASSIFGRKDNCPEDCMSGDGCPYNCIDNCPDFRWFFDRWDSLSEEVKDNHIEVSTSSLTNVQLTLFRMKFKNRRVILSPNGILVEHLIEEVPSEIPLEGKDVERSLLLYAALGSEYRNPRSKLGAEINSAFGRKVQ